MKAGGRGEGEQGKGDRNIQTKARIGSKRYTRKTSNTKEGSTG